MIKLKSFSDCQHGWIGVKRKDIPLEIIRGISQFSYQRGKMVYLEEDSDASLLMNYLKANDIAYEMKAMKFSNRSPIRSYDRFNLSFYDIAHSSGISNIQIVKVGF